MKAVNRQPILVITAAALLLAAVNGFAQGPGAAHKACLAAAGEKYDGDASELKIVSSKPSPGGAEVLVEADGKRWRCLANNQGKVNKLTEVEGAPQAPANDQ